MNKKTFEELLKRFCEIKFKEEFDMIAAVANGGIIPAAILNQRLNIEFNILKINYRDASHQPKYAEPQLLSPIGFNCADKRILVVEDRVKTGASLKKACEILKEAKLIKTFAVNGKADYALYDEPCFMFAWNL
ncbi:MAG: phosphoribosyltransferase [Prevotellaceae bacterium]|jgi:xanthine phosphoribosyltransferase|nr:phosphoribosyltransferase [Prevotellaceae bacterium]